MFKPTIERFGREYVRNDYFNEKNGINIFLLFPHNAMKEWINDLNISELHLADEYNTHYPKLWFFTSQTHVIFIVII